MTRLHKLELAYARARLARGKIRNAQPYGATEPEWAEAEMRLDQALNLIDSLIVREKQRLKALA